MKISDIDEKDQQLMQGLYLQNKNFTYDGIAALFLSQYPEINAQTVGRIIKKREEQNMPYIGLRDEVTNPMKCVEERVSIQKSRKNV